MAYILLLLALLALPVPFLQRMWLRLSGIRI
jgi:hypothetical protein